MICRNEDVAIGNGREMYVERRGSGSSTVVLVSSLAAADLWNREEQPPPKVFPEVSGASIYRDVPITVAPDIPGD